MGIHITKYKTDNGKTRKVKQSGNAKPAEKGAQASAGADNKNSQSGSPVK